jgi:isocitrate dehydrogenase
VKNQLFIQDKSSDDLLLSDKITKVAVAMGDGIGPEIMKATLRVLKAVEAPIEAEFVKLGEQVYEAGNTAGIDPEAWDIIRRNKILLKAPITTPQGKGYKSLNVTLRKSLGLFANVRPCKSFYPFIATKHPELDVVIIRENEEDLYAGIEHRQTQDVVQCLKLITRPGCERIIRYAFEYARVYDRKKVTCMVKDNIMKLTDGLFHQVFKEIGKEYPSIEQEVQIIDIGTAKLADSPENYDVVVTSNLYGDIISDVVAQITGSVGLAGSANVGTECAMFEAIHGSAPDIAGQNIANPSGLINAAGMMLMHIGEAEKAQIIQNALLRTIEDGIHTGDIFDEKVSRRKVNTEEFTDAVIERLGQQPQKLDSVSYEAEKETISIPPFVRKKQEKTLMGVDVFIDWEGNDPNVIGNRLKEAAAKIMQLKMITNRGVKVFPNGLPETFCTDHWRCRFISANVEIVNGKADYEEVHYERVVALLSELYAQGFDVIKTENLYSFDGQRQFSLGQGE